MGRRWTWGGLAALAAALVTLAVPGLAAAANGTITGTVFGPDDAPLAGAAVYAWRGTDLRRSVATDAGGSYSLKVPPGDYAVRIRPSAIHPLPLGAAPAPMWYPGMYARVDAARVTVTSAATIQLADVQLPLEGVITGHVRFPNGTPAETSVLAYDAQGRLVGSGGTSGFLNDDRFVMRGLPPGPLRVLFTSTPGSDATDRGLSRYYVSDEYYDNQFSLAKATPVDVTLGAVTPDINARLARAGTIRGQVRDEQGTSMAGVKVYAVRSDGRRAGPFVSGSDGSYDAYGLQPGEWKLAFVPASGRYVGEYYSNAHSLAIATAVQVSYQSIASADAELAAAGRIRGTVTGPGGSPLAGVRVRAYDDAGEIAATYTTAADGLYTLQYLRAASYRIGFTAPPGSGLADEFYDDAATLAQAAPVTATAGSLTEGIDAVLGSG